MVPCETADSVTFEAVVVGADVPRKLLSERRRDPAAPELQWRLKVYPGGNGVAGYLALYVEVAARHALPAGWAYARALTFTLHHATDAARAIAKHTTHTFTAAEPDWGYNQVIPVAALAPRGYLAAGAVRITATLRPVRAPAPAPLRVATPPADTPAPAPRTPSSPADPPAPLQPPSCGGADDECDHNNGDGEGEERAAATALRESFAEMAREMEGEQQEEQKEQQEEEKGEGDEVEVEVDVGAEEGEAWSRASAWGALDGAHEWRLVVGRSAAARAVGAFVDVRACDAAAGAWAPLTVAVRVRAATPQEHPASGVHTAPAHFSACFAPGAPRHGLPLLALLAPHARGRLVVCAAATPVPEEETPRAAAEDSAAEAVDAQTVAVHGHAAYVCTAAREAQARAGDVCVLSPWRALGPHGRWRLAVYPAGRAAGPAGWVAAAVAFRPAPGADPDWSLRVLLRAAVCGAGPRTSPSQEQEEEQEDTCIAVLDAGHREIVLDRLARVRDIVPEGADDDDDGSVLAVRAVLATCGAAAAEAAAPVAFAAGRVVAGATAALRAGIAAVQDQTRGSSGGGSSSAEGVVPLAGAVHGAGSALCAGVAALERVLARQTAALGRLGTSLDSAERLECLQRRLAALQAERARCLGRSSTAAELDARERSMRAVLKRLLLLQANRAGAGDAVHNGDDATSLVPENQSTCESATAKKVEDKDEDEAKEKEKEEEEEEEEGAAAEQAAREAVAQCEVLAARLDALGAECRRVGALAGVLGEARGQLVQLVRAMPGVVAAERAQRAAGAQTERALAEQCAAVERECRLLRGDDTVLDGLTPEHVSACVDFIVEAVGQMAVAKYLTQK